MSHEQRDYTPVLSHLIRMGRVYASIERMRRNTERQDREAKETMAEVLKRVS